MAKQYGPPKKKKKCAACAHKGSSPKVKGGHDFMNHPAAKAIADIGRGYMKGGAAGAAIEGGHHALRFLARRKYGKKR